MARPKKYNDNDVLSKSIDAYFDKCDKLDKPYTMGGLALALDIDRKTLLNYSKEEPFFHTIKKARQKVEAQLEENALMNKTNSTFTIFNLKNNFEWKDKQEVVTNNEEISKVQELLNKITNEANNDIK